MGVHPEGFQRAIGKPFGRRRSGDSPCNKQNHLKKNQAINHKPNAHSARNKEVPPYD